MRPPLPLSPFTLACHRCPQWHRYTDAKLCWAPKGARPPLSLLPQLSSLYEDADEAFSYAERYARLCEAQLCSCLRGGEIPSAALQEASGPARLTRPPPAPQPLACAGCAAGMRPCGFLALFPTPFHPVCPVAAVAVAKVRAVETVIQLCFKLKQAVGSYALMLGSGFEHLDAMQVAKFAEGESFVLM